eukprot:TRINITY_DN5317_c0_g1_i1.p1 TRINITY_DN5317_c0_g1~~TRINITY_DN5317_c0_g1_i1.p1  ORF type:complete len:234 (-),score=41.66 TRINITY_DN5317_c0_g1_i1:332-1033(-)
MVNLWGGKDGRAWHKRLVRRWEQWTRKWEPLVPDSMSGSVTNMLIPVSGGLLTLFLVWGLLRTLHNRTIYTDSHQGSDSKQLAALLDHGANQSSNLAGDVEFGMSGSPDVELTASGTGTKRPRSDDLWSDDGGIESPATKEGKSKKKKKKLKLKKSKKKSDHRKEQSKELGEPDETSSFSEKKKTSDDRGKQSKEGKRKGKGKRGKPVQKDSSSSLLVADEGDFVEDVSEELG